MKKTILIMCLAAIVAACTSKPAEQAWVKVEGNKFIAPDGSELVFRGLCFSDPVKLVSEEQWNERYFAEAADWGANVVRFAVHPTNLNRMGWEETFSAMDQGIEWAKKQGLYVIIDWHSIGNLKDAKYTNPMYDTDLEETLKAGTGKESVDEITNTFKDFYAKKNKLFIVEGQEEVADTSALVLKALEE